MQISSFTHIGMVRHNNEDSCLVVPPWSTLAINKKAITLAVADGMGGQNAGEVASGMAIKSAIEWLSSNDLNSISTKILEDMFAFINSNIWEYSQQHPETKGMGTTLTMVIIRGETALVGHIGDTRLYRLRDNTLIQLTNDHSLVGEQVRTGKMTSQAARTHPSRHILSRVMGGKQFVVPEIFTIEMKTGDTFMICSDGVSGMLEDKTIEKILKENKVADASKKLIEEANKAGGKDNSTAVVFGIENIPVTFPSWFSFERLAKIITGYGNAGSV